MKIWLDAQLSPALGHWLERSFAVDVLAIQEDPGLIQAKDREIFTAARKAEAVVMTKDRDFVELARRLGSPPSILWVTVGNTSNQALQALLTEAMPRALDQIRSGEQLVEISRAG